MEMQHREVFFYRTIDGKEPFIEWLNSLHDVQATRKVQVRLKRAQEFGNLGDWKYLNSGVFEFRFKGRYGHLRVYYAEMGEIILVLSGGVKDTQDRDINRAKEFLADYEQREGSDER
jgi:putative addiction module killer protein